MIKKSSCRSSYLFLYTLIMLNSSSASPHLHCTSLVPGAGFETSFSWWYTGMTPEPLRLTCHVVNGVFTLWVVDLWLMIHWPKECFLDQEFSWLKIQPATGSWTLQQEIHGQFFTHVAWGCFKARSLYHGVCPWPGGLLGNSVGLVSGPGKPWNPWFYLPDTGSCREIGARPAEPQGQRGPASLIPISLQDPLLALWAARGILAAPCLQTEALAFSKLPSCSASQGHQSWNKIDAPIVLSLSAALKQFSMPLLIAVALSIVFIITIWILKLETICQNFCMQPTAFLSTCEVMVLLCFQAW